VNSCRTLHLVTLHICSPRFSADQFALSELPSLRVGSKGACCVSQIA
jgi:hypothetical protein